MHVSWHESHSPSRKSGHPVSCWVIGSHPHLPAPPFSSHVCFQLIYGGYITDPYDQQTLAAMIDYWISPAAVKKDFELSKGQWPSPHRVMVTSGPKKIPKIVTRIGQPGLGCECHSQTICLYLLAGPRWQRSFFADSLFSRILHFLRFASGTP